MKELITHFWSIYKTVFENGRLIPLFLGAMIVIVLGRKKAEPGVPPLLFLLSPLTAISFAFTGLSFCSGPKETTKRSQTGLRIAVPVFLVLAILLSGRSVWSDDLADFSGTVSEQEAELDAGCDDLLSLEESPKIVASPKLMASLLARSSSFVPLYTLPSPAGVEELPENERQIYEVFLTQHPDLEKIYRICHKEKRFYAIVDREQTWPEHGFENGFDLMDSVAGYDIYAYTGAAYE